LPSVDDEEFVRLAVNCGEPAAVDGEDAKGSIDSRAPSTKRLVFVRREPCDRSPS
jgi:hypothetical protein